MPKRKCLKKEAIPWFSMLNNCQEVYEFMSSPILSLPYIKLGYKIRDKFDSNSASHTHINLIAVGLQQNRYNFFHTHTHTIQHITQIKHFHNALDC